MVAYSGVKRPDKRKQGWFSEQSTEFLVTSRVGVRDRSGTLEGEEACNAAENLLPANSEPL
jgi:hypothetical protein